MFDIKKENLRRKARLVVGGHALDFLHLESHSSVVQSVSVRMLLTITAKNKMKVASRDVGNAFPHADTMEKACTIAGPEFGFREGCKVKIIKKHA